MCFLQRLPVTLLLFLVAFTFADMQPVCAQQSGDAVPFRVIRAKLTSGINLAGAEFGLKAVANASGGPVGVYGRDYQYPSAQELMTAKAQGFELIRLPFLWERLQPVHSAAFSSAEQVLLENTIANARKAGLKVVLDPHNYARWRGQLIGSEAVPVAAFEDFWTRLAKIFANQQDVQFGLMNEPHGIGAKDWAGAAQAAVKAIRATGARNLILIPGSKWTGAHSWEARDKGISNAQAMAGIADSGPHVFEFHQYLDADWSGTSASCRQPRDVVAALSVATRWLRAHRKQGILGEFGAGADAVCLAGLEAMLNHMEKNSDVWTGWVYWAAGAWWPRDYVLSLEPLSGPDRPQMTVLKKAMELTKARIKAHP